MAKKSPTERRRTTTKSEEGFCEPFNIDDVPWSKLPGSTAFNRLGRFGGGSQVGVGIDVLKTGQHSNRFHYHLREEEHVFILKGSATLILGERKYVMRERDYCCFPAAQRAGHHLYNHSGETCLFMTIGDNCADDIVVFPKTGKTHQIRVHLRHIGLPLAIDPLYNPPRPATPVGIFLSSFKRDYHSTPGHAERPLMDRLTLHAERLRFTLPSGDRKELTAPVPKDFHALLNQLRRHSGR